MNSTALLALLINFVLVLKDIFFFLLLGRVIFSWMRVGNRRAPSKIEMLVIDATDPLINLAKKIPHQIGMIDLSPLIAMLAVDFLGQLIAGLLSGLL